MCSDQSVVDAPLPDLQVGIEQGRGERVGTMGVGAVVAVSVGVDGNEAADGVVGGVCGFVVCCAVSDTTPLLLVGVVVLGVLVVIVAGSRPVVLFEPGC